MAPSLHRLTLYTHNSAFLGRVDQLADDTFCKIDCDDGQFRPNAISRLTVRGVGGDLLQLLTVLCPNLETLDVRDGVSVSVGDVNTVLRNCELLRTLDISSVRLLDDTFVASLIVNALSLRRLALGPAVRHLDVEALANVLSAHPSLAAISMDTQDAAVDEEQLLYVLKRSHNGKAFLHVDPECRKSSAPRSFRFVEYHCTPTKYLGSVTPEWSVTDFMAAGFLGDILPPLECLEGGGVVEMTSKGVAQDSGVMTSDDEVQAATALSPQLSVWLGKKLKID